jgi:hypothetical protein
VNGAELPPLVALDSLVNDNIHPGQQRVQQVNVLPQDRIDESLSAFESDTPNRQSRSDSDVSFHFGPSAQFVDTSSKTPDNHGERDSHSITGKSNHEFGVFAIDIDDSHAFWTSETPYPTANDAGERASYSIGGKSNSQPGALENDVDDPFAFSSPDVVELDTPEAIAKKCGLKTVHAEYTQVEQNLFTVINFLGQGSMGFVEEVCVPDSSQKFVHFVRKRVQMPYHLRKKKLDIVKQEAATMKNLHHPHIIKIIGTYQDGSTGGKLFYSLLMFPVGQADLKTLLEMEDELSQTHRAAWFPQWFKCLSSALAYMHANGVRHQDIKPSNIIHRDGDVYFTDFSSASTFAVGQTTSTENPARASYMYAAPEVLESDGEFMRHGRGTDVFALGGVFCEMLATLTNHSVDQFHQFLLKGNHLASRHVGMLYYGKCTSRMDEFFAPTVGAKFYQSCLKKALAINRDDRPNAAEFARNIEADNDRVTTSCACDYLVPRK